MNKISEETIKRISQELANYKIADDDAKQVANKVEGILDDLGQASRFFDISKVEPAVHFRTMREK